MTGSLSEAGECQAICMRLDRRLAIKMTMAALAAAAVGGHTPYGQWTVYRQRNLFIVASRTDEAALALAHAFVEGCRWSCRKAMRGSLAPPIRSG